MDGGAEKRYPACLFSVLVFNAARRIAYSPMTRGFADEVNAEQHCDRRPTDRIRASEARDTGSIPVGRTKRQLLNNSRTFHTSRIASSREPAREQAGRRIDPMLSFWSGMALNDSATLITIKT
jgi:hypothetical protein